MKKSGRVLFPMDINDVQTEIEVDTVIKNENNICSTRMSEDESPFFNDHAYHKFWVFPHGPMTQDSTTQTMERSSVSISTQSENETTTSSVQTDNIKNATKCVQVDTFHGSLIDVKLKHQTKLVRDLKTKVDILTRKNQLLNSQKFCTENLMTSDHAVQFYTGLPNLLTFNALFEYLKPKAETMTYRSGTETADRTATNRGRPRKITLKS